MDVITSGFSNSKDSFRQSRGDAELLRASNNGSIEHDGNAKRAIATHSGRIAVVGEVSDFSGSSDNGIIYAHGDTAEVRSTYAGAVTVAGKPELVQALDHGSVIVFGEPKNIRSAHSGIVTVVTLENDYEPQSITSVDHGGVRIISPGEQNSSNGIDYLNYHLKKVFPEGTASPLFVAYSSLLLHSHDQYLTV